jgi:hypothetical protein
LTSGHLDLSEDVKLTSRHATCDRESAGDGFFCRGTTLVKCCAEYEGYEVLRTWECGEEPLACKEGEFPVIVTASANQTSAEESGDGLSAPHRSDSVDNHN